MTTHPSLSDAAPPPVPARGGLDPWAMVLAWVVIVLGAGLWMLKPEILAEEEGAEAPAVPVGMLIGMQDELAGRLTLGMHQLLPGGGAVDQAAALEIGSTAQRVAHAILVAAIDGPDSALSALDAIEADPVADLLVPPATDAIRAMDEGPPASAAALETLSTRLGWYGDLGAALPDPAELERLAAEASTALFWMLGVLLIFVLAGLGGVAGLITVVVLLAIGRMSFRLPAPARHGVYAETFAIWLLGFLVLQIVAGLLATENTVLLASAGAFFASLAVLGWPVIRGTPWSQVRDDIGLAAPRWSDVPAGVATWAMAIPFLGIGVVLTLILSFIVQLISGEAPQPAHPVQEAAAGAGTWQVLQLLLVASVAAPIVEEIMFRGVLVTHLRGLTRRWNDWLSFGLAAVLSSVLFAAIHPQGLVFIPPLAGLALGFCVGRAWRGGLVPAMVAHGVSNGLVMGLNVLVFAS